MLLISNSECEMAGISDFLHTLWSGFCAYDIACYACAYYANDVEFCLNYITIVVPIMPNHLNICIGGIIAVN